MVRTSSTKQCRRPTLTMRMEVRKRSTTSITTLIRRRSVPQWLQIISTVPGHDYSGRGSEGSKNVSLK